MRMDKLLRDLKYGARVLLNKPGLTFVALLALALGIGANTALFSILYAVLWKPLPYKDPERLVVVWEARAAKTQNVVNPANYMDWKEQNHVFEDVAAFAQTGSVNLTGGDQPEQVPIQYATPNLFQVLGVRPALGRPFTSQDGAGDQNIVILSNGLWVRRFGADPFIVGKDIQLNARKATVVGVMPAGWGWFIKEGSIFGKPPELWMAFPITPEMRTRRGRYLTTVARMKTGVTVKQAQADMDVLANRFATQYPDFNKGWKVNVVPLREQLSGNLRRPLAILSGAVAFVLLIACTNVANLMLARAISRSREMAIRSALGAERSRLVRQLLTECVLLAIVGGVAGLMLAVWGTQWLVLLGQRAGIDFGSVKLNMPVLSFAFVLSLFTGVVFGIVPSVIASSRRMQEQLKEGSRGTSGLHVGKLRNVLVVSQLCIALVLLSGASLLIQSFWKLTRVDPGFDASQVLTFRLLLPSARYPEDSQRIQFFQSLLQRLRALPDVKSAGMVNFLPFGGPAAGTSFHIQGVADPPAGQDRITNVFVGDDGLFHTLHIPIKQGRVFLPAEMQERKNVVLINETLARQYFPGENPLGREITIDMRDKNEPSRIIGVVGDAKQEQLDSPAMASVYWPHPELAYSFMSFVVRTQGDPMAVAPSVIAAVHEMDKDQPLAELRPMSERLGDSTARAQFSMALLVVLAGIAFILAVAGIYGVMSHTVLQRTQEMGIRMALGASAPDVFKMVLMEGGRMLLIGAILGCVATVALTRVMKSMLYETSVANPVSIAIVTAVLVLAGLIACWLPSRRASNVNPIEALRYE